MELILGLGAAPPKIFDYQTNKIAQPNTSLDRSGEVAWNCSDWKTFHQGLVQWFMEGRFQSKIKYSQADAIAQANKVFSTHWENNAGFFSSLRSCAYDSTWYAYFKSVGLTQTINIFQEIANAGTKVVTKTADSTVKVHSAVTDAVVGTAQSAGKSLVNVVDNAGGIVSNVTGMAKYVGPVLIGGVVLFVGTYAYKNFIKGDERISVGPVKV